MARKQAVGKTKRIARREHKGAPSEKRTLQIARAIGLRILAGDYQPGSTIPVEPELCRELGVSRTVLREAIQLLTANGMVTARVKVGTAINPRAQWNFLDPALLDWLLAMGDIGPFLMKLSEFRHALEPAAASLAAVNATFEDFERLHHAYEDMAASTDNLEAWVAADFRFHQAISLATRNEFFWPVGLLLEPALIAGFRVIGSAHNQQCLPEHRAVRDAIIAREPHRAYQAVVDLMRTSDSDLVQMLASGKEKPEFAKRKGKVGSKSPRAGGIAKAS